MRGVGMLNPHKYRAEEDRLEWQDEQGPHNVCACERCMGGVEQFGDVPLLSEGEYCLAKIERREETVEMHENRIRLTRVGQNLHHLMRDHQDPTRHQVEDYDANLGGGARCEEPRVAIGERNRGEPVQEDDDERCCTLREVADKAGLGVDGEDPHRG
eukprot:scaffold112272_cov32-Tisochrysis_lutea.AAC.1